ncbi:MAG: GspE/PulE family protein [Thermodesulfobacteriota bacterium]
MAQNTKTRSAGRRIGQRKRIGDILLEAGLITREQMKAALQRQSVTGGRIGNIMVEMDFLSEENMVGALSKQLGIPSIDLKKVTVSEDLLKLLPENFLIKNQVVPIEREGNILKIAMANPLDRSTMNDIEFMIGGGVVPLVTTPSAVERFLKKLKGPEEDTRAGSGAAERMEVVVDEEQKVDTRKLLSSAESPAIIRSINRLLIDAIRTGTTNVHITPRQNDVLVRYRLDGILRNTTSFPAQVYPAILARLKSIAHMDIGVTRRPQNGGVSVRVGDMEADLRISMLPTFTGEKVVIRVVGKNQKMRNLENLGMHPKDLSTFYSLLSRPHGMILVVGPAGSGTSTTLYTSLRYLRSEESNIITIEDPIEFQIPGINQIQVNPRDGLTFSVGLRSIMHQDPDIIMVSEIRESEIARLMFQSAMMGHLVLSSTYTNNVVSTITHLMNFDIKPHMAASSIAGVVAQRLVRRNCPHCLERYIPEPKVLAGLNVDVMEVSKMNFYRGRGCSKCNDTGYRGQIGIFEILSIDYILKEIILKRASEREIFTAARHRGMTTMEENGLYLVLNKITTLEEILRVIPSDEISTQRKGAWEKQIISLFDEAIYLL